MAKGENIFKRKDGRWEARYIKGYELSGKIRYGFCYGKTYAEAKRRVTECRAGIIAENQKPLPGMRRRFSFYCDEWLSFKKERIKESTYIKYSTVIERHIKPQLGNCYPPGITSDAVDAFSKLLVHKSGLSVKSIHDILVVLRGILKYTEYRLPGIFQKIEINYPKGERKEMRVLTIEEQKRFIKYLLSDTDCCKFGLLLALFTGIRIGELCALRWEDISVREQTVRISATLQRLHDISNSCDTRTRIVIGSPKSNTSARIIPLTDYAAELCRKMEIGNAKAYVLTGSREYMEPRTLQYRIEKYTRECGLDGVHCHTLRHTFATRAVEAGFEIKSLSEVLGHAGTSITLERYVHSSLELKRANMRKLSTVGL